MLGFALLTNFVPKVLSRICLWSVGKQGCPFLAMMQWQKLKEVFRLHAVSLVIDEIHWSVQDRYRQDLD